MEYPEARAFVRRANIWIDPIGCRVLEGETIPRDGKFFPVFGFLARRLSKGESGRMAELGAPAPFPNRWRPERDRRGPIGTDGSRSAGKVPRASRGDLRPGLPSPANRAELDEKLERDALPKKGRPTEAGRARETAPESGRRQMAPGHRIMTGGA